MIRTIKLNAKPKPVPNEVEEEVFKKIHKRGQNAVAIKKWGFEELVWTDV